MGKQIEEFMVGVPAFRDKLEGGRVEASRVKRAYALAVEVRDHAKGHTAPGSANDPEHQQSLSEVET